MENRRILSPYEGLMAAAATGGIAFRRASPISHRYQRRPIKCPICAKPFLEVYVSAKVEVVVNPDESDKACQIYRRCPVCGCDVGIRLNQ